MAFGGTTEFNLIASGAAFGRGVQVWSRISSDESTDFQNIAGYFAGVGARPSTEIRFGLSGGSSMDIGMRVGDVVFAIETTGGTRPGRATLHSVIGSTMNFSTASGYSSTGGYDVMLSNSSTQ